MLKTVIILFLLLVLWGASFGQQIPHGYVVEAVVIDGDTVPMVILQDFSVLEQRRFRSKKYQRQYNRLTRYVLRVYPYAQIAGQKIREYNVKAKTIADEKELKEYMELKEDELMAEFEGEVRDLSIQQGRILIKLIDRETGDTSYELIKEFRGRFTAFMWQAVSRMFGHNLKSEYESEAEDKMIEEIVQKIERGELVPPERVKEPTKKELRAQRKSS